MEISGETEVERRNLTRAQVLAWNENWSARDRERIEAALDEVPDAEYYIPATGGYIGVEVFGSPAAHPPAKSTLGLPVRRWTFHRALIIHRGFLEWPNVTWSKNLNRKLFAGVREGRKHVYGATQEFTWLPLSTVGNSGPRQQLGRSEPPEEFCPKCFLALPASGECDCEA